MQGEDKVFRYKLDFYYQSALIYLVTLILYGGIRGSFVEKRFEYVLDDPLMYVILFFVLVSFVTLLINRMRDRQLVLTGEAVIIRSRHQEIVLKRTDIEWMHIGREKRVETEGKFQAVILKMKSRRRVYRIRVGRYERPNELVNEMKKIAETIPGKRRRRWRKSGITDR